MYTRVCVRMYIINTWYTAVHECVYLLAVGCAMLWKSRIIHHTDSTGQVKCARERVLPDGNLWGPSDVVCRKKCMRTPGVRL